MLQVRGGSRYLCVIPEASNSISPLPVPAPVGGVAGGGGGATSPPSRRGSPFFSIWCMKTGAHRHPDNGVCRKSRDRQRTFQPHQKDYPHPGAEGLLFHHRREIEAEGRRRRRRGRPWGLGGGGKLRRKVCSVAFLHRHRRRRGIEQAAGKIAAAFGEIALYSRKRNKGAGRNQMRSHLSGAGLPAVHVVVLPLRCYSTVKTNSKGNRFLELGIDKIQQRNHGNFTYLPLGMNICCRRYALY